MKRLSIKWVPETAIMLSVGIATSQTDARHLEGNKTSEVGRLPDGGRVIVISSRRGLRAELMTDVHA